MQLDNEITIEKRGKVVILDIRGDITSYSEVPLKTSFQKETVQETKKIIFKFDKEAYINSGGIALLIQILYQAKEKKQKVVIAGISPHYKKIFKMVGISKFARICDSLADALNTRGV